MSNVNNPTSPLASEVTFINDQTPNRHVDGTVYQNNQSKKPMIVVVTGPAGGGGGQFVVKCDQNANPSQTICTPINGIAVGNVYFTFTFVVLPMYYYKVTASNASLTSWIEYV
jgi:hypothetical protein